MANHIDLIHGDLATNECYEFILSQWQINGTDSWKLDDLIYEFGNIAVNEILKENYLIVDKKKNAKLAFKVYGTVCNLISSYTENEIFIFNELLTMFPKQENCSSSTLKSYLIFLENFGIIQFVELPASGITCIYGDKYSRSSKEILDYFSTNMTTQLDKDMDKINFYSDMFNPKYIHIMDVEYGCHQIKHLLNR